MKTKRELLSACLLCQLTTTVQGEELKLWYQQPAVHFEESLPLGNGRMGALVYGQPEDYRSIYASTWFRDSTD